MRILLVRASPVGRGRLGIVPPGIVPPLGILSLAASLRRSRPEDDVRIADASIDFGSAGDMEALVASWEPDIVGLSGLSQEAFHVRSLAAASRRARPDAPVIAGGPIASAFPAGVLEHISELDASCYGEGEETIVEIAWRIASGRGLDGVRGTVFRAPGGALVTNRPRPFIKDLDSLPAIDWGLVDLGVYSRTMNFAHLPPDRAGYVPMITTRGCPYGCSYCHKFFGKNVRSMSPAAIAAEMDRIARTYGVREFHIVDDIFNHRRGRVIEFCREIEARRLDVRLAFPNGLRGDILDAEDVGALSSTGLFFTALAIESVVPRIQRLVRKNLDVERVFEVASSFAGGGVLTRAFVMLGFPTETREEMEETVRRVVESEFHMAMFFSVTPYPGTPLFDIAVRSGFDPRLWVEKRFTYDRDFVNTSTLPDGEYGDLLREARRRFYTHPGRRDRLVAWLATNGITEHPYIRQSTVWRMILESASGEGAWAEDGDLAAAPATPPPDLVPGLALASGWRVAAVRTGTSDHEIEITNGHGASAVLLLSPRDDAAPCMARSGPWNIGIRSERPIDTLPRDLEEAVRSFTAILSGSG